MKLTEAPLAIRWLDRAVAHGLLGRAGNAGGAWISPDEATQWYLTAGRDEDALQVARDVFERAGGASVAAADRSSDR